MKDKKPLLLVSLMILLLHVSTLNGYSQLKGVHLLGDFGLSAGTQPAPSLIAAVPLYWYDANTLKDSKGNVVNHNPNLNMFLTAIGGSLVSNAKILGANWGASVLVPFVSNRIEGNFIQSNSSLQFSDMFVQPIQLGWHRKQADFIAGYSLYIPTGKYSVGGSDNTGLGMWGNEFSAGSTVYFDAKKSFNFSTIVFYEIHSNKKNSDLKAGNIMTLEGGLGKTFYKKISGTPVPMIFNVGIPYYMQFKVSDDHIPVANTYITGTKDHTYGLGLEASVFYPRSFTSIGFRWIDEVGAKNRFQGNTYFITISQFIIRSFEKKK